MDSTNTENTTDVTMADKTADINNSADTADNTSTTENNQENEATTSARQEDQHVDNNTNNQDVPELEDEHQSMSKDELIAQLKKAEQKADEHWDQVLRYQAEAQNVRRRSENDVAKARKFGIEKIAQELLPVIDSMELGLQAANDCKGDAESVSKIVEGMEMTLKMMLDALEKHGIKAVAPKEGDPFNAELHQAMSMQEVEGKDSNTIISVFQKGYTLNDRLLRAAMVMVAK